MSPAAFSVRTPSASPGAVGIIELRASGADELDRTLASIGVGPIGVGGVALSPLFGIDRGLIARIDASSALLFPHGSPAVLRGLAEALGRAGLREQGGLEGDDPWLSALAAVRGRRGLELLLTQREPAGRAASPEIAVARRRLFEPPMVLAWGPPNIGKSSVLNALAGRRLAITADEPGVTTDSVGAEVELDGLVVRWFDAAGIGPGAPGAAADQLLGAADLVLLCGDPNSPPPGFERTARPTLRVCLRSDLGRAAWACDVEVTIRGPESSVSLEALGRAVRHRLLPDAALDPLVG